MNRLSRLVIKSAWVAGVVSGTTFGVGCSSPSNAEEAAPAAVPVSQGLTIEREPQVLRGTLERGDSLVTFESRYLGEAAASLVVRVNGKRLEIAMDANDGWMQADGHDAILTTADRTALSSLATELGTYLVAHAGAPHELFAAVNAEYWSEAPEGFVHRFKNERLRVTRLEASEGISPRVRPLGNGDDGVTCITKNTTRTAYYDVGTSGTVYSQSVVVNSNWGTNNCGGGDYSCMGRCGGGCGWGAPSSYTLDCLDHDTCSHNLCGSGGGSDSNCGDEYNMAQDDWSQGVLRGCYG